MKVFISTSSARPKGSSDEELTPLQKYNQFAKFLKDSMIRQTRNSFYQNKLKLAELAQKVPEEKRTKAMNDLIAGIPEFKKNLVQPKSVLRNGYSGLRSAKPRANPDSPASRAVADLSELSEKELAKLSRSEISELLNVLRSETPKPKNALKYEKILKVLLANESMTGLYKKAFNFKKPIAYKRENLEEFLEALLSSAEHKDIQEFKLDGSFQKFGAHPPLVKELVEKEFKKYGYKVTLDRNSEGTMTVYKKLKK